MSWTNLDYEICLRNAPHPNQGPLSDSEYCNARAWLAQPSVPLGNRTVPVLQPRFSLPTLVSGPTANPSADISKTVIAGGESPHEESLQVAVPADFVSWHDPAKGEYIARVNGQLVKKTTAQQGPVVSNDSGGNMPLDLGNILGTVQQVANIYSTINNPRGGAGVDPGGMTWPSMGGIGGATPVGEGFDVPFVDLVPQMPTCDPNSTRKPVLKYSCGQYKWVWPKRRRRKALVTKGDASGLAVLKGIVGVGKTMDTWIATHS